MEYRTFGRTGWQVSALGFGGGGIGEVWGPTTQDESVRAVHRALELGINFFDVAPSYGNGKAELALGRGLAGRTEPAYVATKFRIRPDERGDIGGAIRRSFAESLERLGVDRVDLLQLHNNVTVAGDEQRLSVAEVCGPVADALAALKAEGVLSAYGFTGYGQHAGVLAVIESGRFDSVQLHYNPLHLNAITINGERPLKEDGTLETPLFGAASAAGLGVIGIRPLAAGALTEAVDRPVQPGTPLARDIERVGVLAGMARELGLSLSQFAIRYVLMNQAISTTVPGFKNAQEVEDAVAALDAADLSVAHLAAIERHFASLGAPTV